MDFSDAQLHRYARHLILDEIGDEGQERLLHSAVLIVGAGGLGSPVALYLAAAGVGRIGIIDDDHVELSNLQRQILHRTPDIGRPKVQSATDTLRLMNPDIVVEPHHRRLDDDTAQVLLPRYDVIADGSDNFATRYILNDACHRLGRTLVSAAILRFDAQIATFKSYLGPPHPCYRCIFPEPPPPGTVARCDQAGVLGALAGIAGTLQAIEIIKELLGIGDSLSGSLLLYDALNTHFHKLRVARNPNCMICAAG